MRKNAGSWIIKVLFTAIILSFVFFYGYGDKGGPEERVLATVGDRKITTTQYREAYSNMLRMYQQMSQNQISESLARSLGLRQNLLDEMIDQQLLLQDAESRKLFVSKEEIKRAVMQQQYMQVNGVFSEQKYATMLKRMKLTAAEYEQQAAQEIMLTSLRSMITQSVDVSDQELSDVFFLRNQKLKIDYLEFSQSGITEDVAVGDEEIKAYYDKNADTYRIEEMARARYIVFDPQEFIGRMTIEPEDIQDCYNAERSRFVEPEQVRARHILLKADREAEPQKAQAAREQAQELLEKIKNGAAFAALAKKYSQDEASAGEGGDLGFFARGVMVGPFEEVAFSLKPGDLSEIVETPFGYHIIRLEEKKPRRVRPLDEVRGEIVRELQQGEAENEVRRASRRAFNRLFKSGDLEGYAKTNGLSVRETELFVFGAGPEDAQSENAFSKQLFTLQPDELASVFAIGKKYYLIKMKEKKEAHIAPLEDVRDAVQTAVQREKRFELARQQAGEALKALAENNFDWAAVAKKNRLKIKTVELTRSGDFVAGLGRNPALKQAAFKLEDGQTADQVFATESSSVLIRAQQKILPTQEAFEQEKKALRQQLLQAKQQEAFDQYIIELKKQYPVDVDRDLFETF